MTRLKTLRTLPPGGWIFEQKLANGTVKKIQFMTPFGEALVQIRAFRVANNILPQDLDSIALELESQTVLRLGEDSKYCDSKKKTLLSHLAELPTHVSRVVKHAAAAGEGARILMDWIGDGMHPVDSVRAQKRANVCLRGGPADKNGNPTPCPHNQESHGAAMLTDKIAAAILEQRRQKSNMGLKVGGEDHLFTCQICTCHLPLKVWVPMETIVARMSEKKIQKFPSFCWMRTENPPPKEPTT